MLGIHDSSAFYSILLSFFVLEIFRFSWTSLFVKFWFYFQILAICTAVRDISNKAVFLHSYSNHSNLEMEEERDRYRTYWLFSFTQITEKKPTISLQEFTIFNVYHIFTPRSVDAGFCISSANMTSGTKRSFWFQKIPASGELNRKNTRKNMKFWSLTLITRDSIEKTDYQKDFLKH